MFCMMGRVCWYHCGATFSHCSLHAQTPYEALTPGTQQLHSLTGTMASLLYSPVMADPRAMYHGPLLPL